MTAARFATLPAFCRLAATLKPSSDSDIKIEVWLPASGWNGKYQAVGNGAFSGSIAYPAMAAALARGYATSSTDTGHTGNTASWAVGPPGKGRRLRMASRPRDDDGRQAHHHQPLRSGAEVLLLDRLFRRRTAGDEGGAASSRTTSTASLPARRDSTGRPGPHGPYTSRRHCSRTPTPGCRSRRASSCMAPSSRPAMRSTASRTA